MNGASAVNRLDRLGHLAQHPLARGAADLLPQLGPIGGREQRGQLEEPRRRVLAQHVNDALAARRAPQSRQGVEHRQVRFPGAVLFQTLSARDPDARNGRRLMQHRR